MPQPLTDELLQWVREQQAGGADHDHLLQAMSRAGWDAAVALQALQALQHADPPGEPDATGKLPPALPQMDLQGSPRALVLPDRTVSVLGSLQRPHLVVLADFLSAAECEALIDAARPRLARSHTVQPQTGGEQINPDRTSDGMFFARGETALVQRIEARIAALLHWPVERGEGLQVLRYGPGAHYKPHYDYFDPTEPGTPAMLRRGGQRVATLLMYLNEPARGGGTTFPDVGLEVMPQRGQAVFFRYDQPSPATRTLHGGAPVMAGEKWIATKWLRERTFP